MEALVLVLLGVLLSGQASLWYKMGKVEQAIKDHNRHLHPQQ